MNYTQTKEKIFFFILLIVFFLLSFNFSFAWDSRITFTEYTDSIIMLNNGSPSASIMWKDNESTGTYFYTEGSEIGIPKPTISGDYHFVGGPSWFLSQYQADNMSFNDFMINYPNAGDYTNYFLYEVSSTPAVSGCMDEGVYSYNPNATVTNDFNNECYDIIAAIRKTGGALYSLYDYDYNAFKFALEPTTEGLLPSYGYYTILGGITQSEGSFKIDRPYAVDSYYIPEYTYQTTKTSSNYSFINLNNEGLSDGRYFIRTILPYDNQYFNEGRVSQGFFNILNGVITFESGGLIDNEDISNIPECGFSCVRLLLPENDTISETTNINIEGDFFVSSSGWTSFGDFNGILIKLVNISTDSDEIETKEIFIERYELDLDQTFETSIILPENTTWKAQAFIRRGVTLMGKPSNNLLINVISKPLLIDDTEVCESFNILCHLRNFTKWAFYGGTDNFYELEKVKQSIEKKPPFGYVSSIFVIIENIRTDRTAVFELQSNTNITDNIFTPLKNGLSWVLWLLFAFYLFKRFKHIEL